MSASMAENPCFFSIPSNVSHGLPLTRPILDLVAKQP